MPGPGQNLIIDPQLWKLLLGAALIVFSFIIYRRTFPPLPAARRLLLGASRMCGFLLLMLFALDPGLVTMSEERRAPLVLALVDVSKSMSVDDCNGRTRLEAAAGWLDEFVLSLPEEAGAEVEILPFSSKLYDGSVHRDSLPSAAGEGTDILGTIHAALRRYRGRNLAGIVLLTDGRVTRGMTTSSREMNVPVYAVGFGDTLEKPDIAVVEALYDRVTYVGTESRIEAKIRTTGFAGRTVEVLLLENGSVTGRKRLEIDDDRGEMKAEFDFGPQREGDYRMVVSVVPPAGEERTENNEETFRISVLKDRLTFLYLDELADWNMTYIRDLARKSKRLEVEAVSWIPRHGHFILPDRRAWAFPDNPAGLSRYDLVVVADDTKILHIPGNAQVLSEYVRGGGSLLLLADEHSPLLRIPAVSLLEGVLPVKMVGGIRIEMGEYSVRIAPEEFGNPLGTAFYENVHVDVLPPIPGWISGFSVTADAHIPFLVDRGGSTAPFLAVRRHEEGVAAVMLGFPLWRWRLADQEGERAYDAFFGSLVQYLSEGIDSPALEIDSDRTVYRAGDRVRLTAYIGETRFLESLRGEVAAKGKEESPLRTFLFEPDPGRRGYYVAELEPLPPGDYSIAASEIRSDGEGSSGAIDFSVTPVSVEFIKTSRDAAFLRTITGLSGGGELDGAELVSLSGKIELREDYVVRKKVSAFRESPLFFIGIVFFFALEWILRKAWGLV